MPDARQPASEYVQSSIMIPTQGQAAMRTFVFTDMQIFRNDVTTTRAFLRCTPGINQYNSPASFFRFALTELYESSPGHISYTLVKDFVAILLHTLYVQVFKRDELIFVDQLTRFLVSEIIASVSLTLVSVLQGANRLPPLRAAFGQFLFLAVQPGHIFCIPPHPSLALNLVAVGEDGKCRQSQINTHNLIRWWHWLGFDNTRETGVPVTDTITPDSQGFAHTFKWPMQLDFYITDFGEANTAVIEKSPVSFLLWISERIVTMAGLEAWVSWFLAVLYAAEESTKGKVNPLLGILHSLSMSLLQPLVFLLPLCQEFIRLIPAQRHLFVLPGITAHFQRLIVYPSAGIKTLLQCCTLCGRWEKPVLEGFTHRRTISCFYTVTSFM